MKRLAASKSKVGKAQKRVVFQVFQVMAHGGARTGAGRKGEPNIRPRHALTIVQRYVKVGDWKKVVETLVDLAVNEKDVVALKLLLEYHDGKPFQRVEHSGPAGGPIAFEYQDPLDELVNLLAREDEPRPNPEPVN
jgi:hypothetical protein